MGGLARICKMYGKIKVKGSDGREVTWLYDYATDTPRLEHEMTKEEIIASNKEKGKLLKRTFDKLAK